MRLLAQAFAASTALALLPAKSVFGGGPAIVSSATDEIEGPGRRLVAKTAAYVVLRTLSSNGPLVLVGASGASAGGAVRLSVHYLLMGPSTS